MRTNKHLDVLRKLMEEIEKKYGENRIAELHIMFKAPSLECMDRELVCQTIALQAWYRTAFFLLLYPSYLVPYLIRIRVKRDAGLDKLNRALIANDLTAVQQILDANMDLVNRRDELGRGPLHVAVSESRIEIVELLLSRGAIVNTCDDLTGASPLLKAVAQKRPSIVELLLRSGADVSLRNSSDKSALDLAKATGNDEIIKLLDHANP